MSLEEKNFAIYLAEREVKPKRSGEDFAYHTFLMLIDETTKPVSIVQQLHFTDVEDPVTEDLYLLPNARLGISADRALDRVRAYPLIGGKEGDVLEMWNYALSYASYVKVMKPSFSLDYATNPEAVNCRAGIVATLRVLGIDVDHSLFTRDAGVHCKSLPLGTNFNKASGQQKRRSLSELWQFNESFRTVLDAPWIPRMRYVGPIKRRFTSMDNESQICNRSFERA